MSGNRSSSGSSNDSIIFTPPSTVFEFEAGRTSSSPVGTPAPTNVSLFSRSPFTFGEFDSSLSAQASNELNNIFSSSSQDTSSNETTATSVSTVHDDSNARDKPLPSVENESSTPHVGQNSTETAATVPSPHTQNESARTNIEGDPLRHIHTQKARFETPERQSTESPERTMSTPSISITPVPQVELGSPQSNRSQSLINGLGALNVNSPSPSPETTTVHAGRSPTTSPRRRSGSRSQIIIHRIEDEKPPESLFYSREVQNTLAYSKRIVTKLSNVLSSSDLHQDAESSINHLYRQVTELKAFGLQSRRVVGLVGDSGAGKSSLINSLLDYADLARASNSGQACTCVVTEYRYHDQDDFVIQTEYFTLAELKTTYEDLLAAYRHNKELPRNGSRKEDESKELQKKADLALSTFRASFRERLDLNPTILSTMAFDAAVQTMLSWARTLLPSHDAYGRSAVTGVQESYRTVKECSDRLSRLTSEVESSDSDRQAQPWPFVKRLTVCLNSVILSKGLIIADLPGLRDSNVARQNITERYIRDCHQIFAVAKIDRAVTDQSVKDIFNLAHRAGLSNISIVCTRSDEVNASQSRNDWPRERSKIDAMNSKIKDQEKIISALEDDLKDFLEDEFPSQEEMQEERVMTQQCNKAKQSKRDYEFELEAYLIQLRNDRVSSAVRKQYKDKLPKDILRVFCVSNKKYWKARPMSAPQAQPHLQLSGILALRRYCIGVVAESHYQATKDFVNDDIPAFVASLQSWLQAGLGSASAEKKKEVQQTLTVIQDELSELTSPLSNLNDISSSLRSTFRAQLQNYTSHNPNVEKWSRSAGDASTAWYGYYHSTYAAFCRNYGAYETRSQRYTDWNEEAMADMMSDVMPYWNAFTENIHHLVLVPMQQSIEESWAKAANHAAVKAVRSNPQDMRPTWAPLIRTLLHRQRLVTHGVESAIDEFEQIRLAKLRSDAFSSVRTAFTGRLMEDTYHAANMNGGTGVDRRRKALITARFSSPTLIHEHRGKLKDAFNALADELELRVRSVVEEQVRLVTEHIELIRSDNVILESEKNPEFRDRLGKAVREVSRELAGLRIGDVDAEGMDVDVSEDGE